LIHHERGAAPAAACDYLEPSALWKVAHPAVKPQERISTCD
jgi:hypothetical protein